MGGAVFRGVCGGIDGSGVDAPPGVNVSLSITRNSPVDSGFHVRSLQAIEGRSATRADDCA
ncbi:hypothetical protein [Achromobacter piechaudii]|uniref:hypothetical protein n=1 Tax=Achromobacter piechaudii TaxID=72556 RepID=UPI0015817DAA|nr:hypothetical protein [Achromobacter piechaudii]